MDRKVKIRTRDKRYIKGTQYPFTPAQCRDSGIYLTGQIINPKDSKTSKFLSLDEATGKKMISEEKALLFPFVIDPFIPIPVKNNMILDLSIDDEGVPINVRDQAYYKMFLLHTDTFAKSEVSYDQVNHKFYFVDEQAVAEESVSRKRELRAVLNAILDLPVARLKDIALLLNVYDSDFKVNPEHVSSLILEDKVSSCVEKKPLLLKGIFNKDNSFTDKAKDDLFIAKLVQLGEIRINVRDFYYQNTYLGSSTEDVKKWMKSKGNSAVIAKWNAMVSKVSAGEVVEVANEPIVIETGKKSKSI